MITVLPAWIPGATMNDKMKRIATLARERFGEGELQVDRHGHVYWAKPDGRLIPLGYNMFEAESILIRWPPARDAPAEDGDAEE
jgi:hypothetical protein